ncbi:helix-turn-helix transcriptional regulator [Pseudonocardia acaciae]|uniref:helix-turn-helix transcriptional regulator n=1 Tax=Pseudonocardia acaciae TaxID=551276 RepID=UPI00048B4470|nr:WYL domain-containing protein [Pseudonocardia acaciae]
MRASRLLSLLLLLQNRGRMTAPALAAELEVSVRTVYRDVESLGAAGVPIYADRGPDGGYRLLDGYRTRLTGLTSDEAESLFLAGVPGPAAELGLGGALAAAQLKLSAALPPELRERASTVARRFHLDAPGWFRDAEDTPFLSEIAAAVWRERRIAVRYRRWGRDEVDRELNPLGLVLKAGVWYLVATRVSDGESEPRTYRVARVLALRDVARPARRPDGFDLAAFWRGRSEELRAALWRGTATVRLSPRGRELLPLLVGSVEARAMHESATEPDEHGWVTATLPIESHRHAESAFLRLGAEIEVLTPPDLRARMAATARALAARYAPD